MGMQDLLPAVERKLPIKIIVFKNSELGFGKLEMEEAGPVPQYGALKQFDPDLADFARLCGRRGRPRGACQGRPGRGGIGQTLHEAFHHRRRGERGRGHLSTAHFLAQVLGFGRSKIKEAALAISGNTAQWKNLSEEMERTIDKLDRPAKVQCDRRSALSTSPTVRSPVCTRCSSNVLSGTCTLFRSLVLAHIAGSPPTKSTVPTLLFR